MEGVCLTGLKYIFLSTGPTIENEGAKLLTFLNEKLFYEYELYESIAISKKIISKNNYNIKFFNSEEMIIIDYVINKLKNLNCSTLIKKCSELPFDKNQYISYEYSDKINII